MTCLIKQSTLCQWTVRSRRYRSRLTRLPVTLCSVCIGKARPSVDTAFICFAECAAFATVAVIVRQQCLTWLCFQHGQLEVGQFQSLLVYALASECD